MPVFIANRISANHNLLFPDRIDIDEERVIYYKGAIIGYQTTVIPRECISSVRLLSNILFADIIIESSGGIRLEIEGLSKSDARELYSLLQQHAI
ncbi:MAG: PH domain-containing protein [Bacteroidales bacterium]|nr:PH domain-containing protein [Bacteroidales bacterium]